MMTEPTLRPGVHSTRPRSTAAAFRPVGKSFTPSLSESLPSSFPPSSSTPRYTSPGDLSQMSPQRQQAWQHTPSSTLMPPPCMSPYAYSPRNTPNHFTSYPHQYPSHPSYPQHSLVATLPSVSPGWGNNDEETAASTSAIDEQDMAFDFFEFDPNPPSSVAPSELSFRSTSPSKKSTSSHTPRPPNAWILYRSDKLKAIAAGDTIDGLEAVMEEMGVSASSGSAESAEGEGEGTSSKGKKAKKPKRGAKEPTEGLLSLGRGKTGRGLPQADISKMISLLWKRESPEVRGEYERMSELKKIEHQEKYPGYKFQPLRKADKVKMREEREREKEIARREKEIQRTGGRGSRRTRVRGRLSPTAPYSILSVDDQRAMNRNLSYGYPNDGSSPGWDGVNNNSYGQSQSLPLTPAEHRLRSYPFPMPPGSLPSMGPEDHVDNPFADASLAQTPAQYYTSPSIGVSNPTSSGPSPGPGPARAQPVATVTTEPDFPADVPMRQAHTYPADMPSISWSAPPWSTAPMTQPEVANDAAQQAPTPMAQDVETLPLSAMDHFFPGLLDVDWSTAIVEPNTNVAAETVTQASKQVPAEVMEEFSATAHQGQGATDVRKDDDGDKRGDDNGDGGGERKKNKGKGRRTRQMTPEEMKANTLAAMWCLIEEVQEGDGTMSEAVDLTQREEASGVPASASTSQKTLISPTARSFAQVELWTPFPANPEMASWEPAQIDENGQPLYHTVPEGVFWYQPMPYPGPDGQVTYAPSDVGYPHGLYMDPSLDPTGSHYTYPFCLPNPSTQGAGQVVQGIDSNMAPSNGMIPINAMVEETGPFLSEQAVVSPTEAEFIRPTNPNANDHPTRHPSVITSNSDGALQAFNLIPRAVSASAYPPTPLSVDPSSLPGNSGWTERYPSYSAADMIGPLELEVGEDMLQWDTHGDENTRTTGHLDSQSRSGRAGSTSWRATPIPTRGHNVATVRTNTPVSMRGGTRGRSVARRYDEGGTTNLE